jgi:hypothetical protein
MTYTCSVCGEKVDGGTDAYIDHTQSHIIEYIKRRNPEWVQEDGMCPRCVEYVTRQIQGDSPKGS